jgi:hypothetical protein
MKRIWQKPKLIILERGRPEEMVLAGCKLATVTGPSASKTTCYTKVNCKGPACSEIATS